METREENSGNDSNNRFKAKLGKLKRDFVSIGALTKQIIRDDPRRVVHSFKVGFAIALVSLFYYFDPLYEGFGVNAMWAVLTVVVVFEYSVGATLGKSSNRVVATIIGGWSAVGAHRLSSYLGDDLEPLLLGFFVFITAAVTTFMRFYPKIKARFDYGMVIFILTFSLICVSGYRDDEVIDMAQRRINTILIGCTTAVIICVLIWPVWAGADLHKLTASNIEKLGIFLEEFGVEYFKNSAKDSSTKPSWGGVFKNVLDSKSSVDSLANFARWEPRHGRFRYRHPWSQYQKICALTRDCACKAEALQSFIYSQTQAPKEVKAKFQETFTKMSGESGKALIELSTAIKEMNQPTKAKPHIRNAKQAAENLNAMLRSNIWENVSLLAVTPAATVAALLADVVVCTEELVEAVHELATLAKFNDIVDTTAAEVALPERQKSMLSNQLMSFNSYVIIVEASSQSTPRSSVCEDPPSLAMAQHNAE